MRFPLLKLEVCESEPTDLATVGLHEYKGLKPPLTDWPQVRNVCQRLGRQLLKLELEGAVPETVDESFLQEAES